MKIYDNKYQIKNDGLRNTKKNDDEYPYITAPVSQFNMSPLEK